MSEHPCVKCEIRKYIARLCHGNVWWHGPDDCPYVCPHVKEEKSEKENENVTQEQ